MKPARVERTLETLERYGGHPIGTAIRYGAPERHQARGLSEAEERR